MPKKDSNQNSHVVLLTAHEVCEQLRLPRSTVYYLTSIGKIPAVRIGKHWRYHQQEISKYLLEGTRNLLPAEGNRRHFPRINVSFPCAWQVEIENRKEVRGTGKIQNLSEGGVLVECESLQEVQETLEADDPICLTFDWLGEVQGRVVRLQKNGRTFFAVVFRHLEREVKKKIREFIG